MFDHNFENLNKHDLYIKSKQVSSPKEKIKCLERITEIDSDDAYAWHQLGNLFASFNEILFNFKLISEKWYLLPSSIENIIL